MGAKVCTGYALWKFRGSWVGCWVLVSRCPGCVGLVSFPWFSIMVFHAWCHGMVVLGLHATTGMVHGSPCMGLGVWVVSGSMGCGWEPVHGSANRVEKWQVHIDIMIWHTWNHGEVYFTTTPHAIPLARPTTTTSWHWSVMAACLRVNGHCRQMHPCNIYKQLSTCIGLMIEASTFNFQLSTFAPAEKARLVVPFSANAKQANAFLPSFLPSFPPSLPSFACVCLLVVCLSTEKSITTRSEKALKQNSKI